ncbi:aldehyde dehydrogenase family protein, partial [Paraburkholderia sp. BR14262]|uniref:aldehyde dehydrogenase family protein n=1 Tax=Paraburkholderia sp. BR14262 TaxID=3236999 RepID=UPI0034CEF16A
QARPAAFAIHAHDAPADPRAALDPQLAAQRAAILRAPFPSWDARARHLRALRDVLFSNRDALAEAMNADFGQRSKAEVALAEFVVLKQEIDAALRHGARWMKPRRRPVGKWLLPGRAKLVPQPLGVAGIVVPWNYPLQLAASPLVCALAAGNRAMIKMSELTPRTSALFAELIGKTFARDHVAVVNGDASVGAAFSALPFDHLLFTGSTRVGHEVMRAAAANLTPVTLELGGSSPQSVFADADFDAALPVLVAAIVQNAGQTCSAGSRVLIERNAYEPLIDRLAASFGKLRVGPASADLDCGPLINEKQRQRVRAFLDEAAASRIATAASGTLEADAPSGGFYEVPTLLRDVPPQSRLAQEEEFGPVLAAMPFE